MYYHSIVKKKIFPIRYKHRRITIKVYYVHFLIKHLTKNQYVTSLSRLCIIWHCECIRDKEKKKRKQTSPKSHITRE